MDRSSWVTIILSAIGAAILFAITEWFFVLSVGIGIIMLVIGHELVEYHDDNFPKMAVFTVVFCVISSVICLIMPDAASRIIFWLLASFNNAGLCAAMSAPDYAASSDRVSYRWGADEEAHFTMQTLNSGKNIFLMVVNMVIFLALAIPGLVMPTMSFLCLIYPVVRIVFLFVKGRIFG